MIRVAKTNLVTFGSTYRTEPVHTLHEREHGPDSVLVRVVPGPIVWGDLASMELWEDATRKPDDDSKGFSPRALTLVEKGVKAVEELVMAAPPDGHVTREDVEGRLGEAIDRRRWLKVDEHLNLHPVVIVERGALNRVLYRRRLTQL